VNTQSRVQELFSYLFQQTFTLGSSVIKIFCKGLAFTRYYYMSFKLPMFLILKDHKKPLMKEVLKLKCIAKEIKIK